MGELYDDELHIFNSCSYVIKMKKRTGRPCNTNGRNEKRVKFLIGKSKEKTPIGGYSHRWEDNIKTDLMEIEFEGVNWIHVAQGRNLCLAPVNAVIDLPVP